MKEEYSKWHSPYLGHETEMLIFGHKGYPVILFPTSMGRYYQNKDFKLVESVQGFIEKGRIKIYCPDSIDASSWYNKQCHPSERARNHNRYDAMILHELVKRARQETGYEKVAVAGCSFGGYHAVNFGFRHPSVTGYIFSMGGAFDIKPQVDGYYDDDVYFNNPVDFIPGLNDPLIWELGIILGTSDQDICLDQNRSLSDLLNWKGIPHWLDIRSGVHDWPVWREMFPSYISKII
jgi:esterase/lipase superfamily enzyme